VPNGAKALSVIGINGSIWLWLEADAETLHKVTRIVSIVRNDGVLVANRGEFVGTVMLGDAWHVFVG